MQQPRQLLRLIALTFLAITGVAHAQELWKYTDKDGKVTYSDKAPKKGETAQLVPNDPSANIISAPKNTVREGRQPEDVRSQRQAGARAKTAERDLKREKLSEILEAAKAELEKAKAALEKGRDPLPEEIQITVGRNDKGAPTGANSQMRKPEFFKRLASLEEAVKNAEANVDVADRNYRDAL